MASSLVRGKYVICKVTGRREAQVIEDGAVFQRDGVIVEVGPVRRALEKASRGRDARIRRARRAARLRQQPPPSRPHAAADGLARLPARAVVGEPACEARRGPLSGHAAFRVRDDRVGHHHRAAHAQPAERAHREHRGRLQRDHQGLRRHRHARLVLVRDPRAEPFRVRGGRGVREVPARRPRAGGRRDAARADLPGRRELRAVRIAPSHARRTRSGCASSFRPRTCTGARTSVCRPRTITASVTASRCTCICWRRCSRRNTRGGAPERPR